MNQNTSKIELTDEYLLELEAEFFLFHKCTYYMDIRRFLDNKGIVKDSEPMGIRNHVLLHLNRIRQERNLKEVIERGSYG